MNSEIKEYFDLLLEACCAEDFSLRSAYRQLRELLEHLCRTQMADSSLQMTDLSARINFVSSKLRTDCRRAKSFAYFPAYLQCRFEPSGRTFAGAIAARCQNIVFFCKTFDGRSCSGRAVPLVAACGCCVYCCSCGKGTCTAHACQFPVCR